jgi:hypothetical protein
MIQLNAAKRVVSADIGTITPSLHLGNVYLSRNLIHDKL